MMNMVEARQFNRKSGHFSVLSSVSGLALATALMWPGSPAQAACSPAAAAGTPSGGTVTCSATTNNQQGGGVGYGTGTQNNNTITIQSGASVTGDIVGFNLGTGNTINNNNGGTIATNGGNVPSASAISTITSNSLTVNNTGTISGSTSSATGAAFAINSGDVIVSNSGNITSAAPNGGNESGAIQGNTITITNNSGNITSTGTNTVNGSFALFALTNVTVSANTGTIAGVDVGITTTGTANITNNLGGTITGTGASSAGILAQGATTVNNAGTISGSVNGINTATSAATTIINTGTISNSVTSATPGAIRANSATITNSGTITGVDAIFFRNAATTASSITNSGTITGSGGSAIHFSTASSGNTLTLGPGSVINGTVAGGANNIFQLGGTGSDSFNVSNIGPQYQNFSVFNKIGTSTWTLTGSGAQNWNISGGTLVGDTNSIQGTAITNNAALVFDQSFNGTYAGAINGTGTLTKQGSGTVVLSGLDSAGATNVNAGILSVTGTLTSPVAVNSGGTLAGNGTIVGNLNVLSGGTVAPGNNAFGTLNVAGGITFGTGSTFLVKANDSGQADKLAATGTATLNGGTVQVLATGTFAASQQYTILSASSVNGQFATVTTNLAFLTPTLTYGPTSVMLSLARNATLFRSAAQSPNQMAVAAALDNSPASSGLVTALTGQSAAGARQAFDALSGEVYGSLQENLVSSSFVLRLAILDRLRQAGYAGAPGELGALSFGGPQSVVSEDALANAAPLGYAGAYPVKAAPLAPAPSRDLTFWAHGIGGWGKVESDGNAAELKSNFAGFISGVDGRFGEMLRLGVAGGYSHTSLDVDARASSAGIDTGHIGTYAGLKLGAFNLRGGAAYSFHTIDTNRMIVFPGFFDMTKGHFDGSTGQVFGEVGYGTVLGRLAVEPFAGLAWVHVHTGGFLESGGLAALNVGATSENVGYSSLGLRTATIILLNNGMALVPRAAATWQHAFGDINPTAAVAFQSTGTAFSVAGVPIARDAALIEGGLDLRFTRAIKVGITYTGELAAHAHTHGVKGGFTWNF